MVAQIRPESASTILTGIGKLLPQLETLYKDVHAIPNCPCTRRGRRKSPPTD